MMKFMRLLLFLLATLVAVAAAAAAKPRFEEAVAGWASRGAVCRGTAEECLAAGYVGEFDDQLDSGLDRRRRILELTGYISYGALFADITPCSITGASYYNCQPGAEANSYSRDCSVIAHCRS